MPLELKVPEVGESITEVMIGAWKKKEGEAVRTDEPVVEIESDKATVELPAPGGGRYAGVVKEINDQSVLFDFNHPLAGQAIDFEVEILGVL